MVVLLLVGFLVGRVSASPARRAERLERDTALEEIREIRAALWKLFHRGQEGEYASQSHVLSDILIEIADDKRCERTPIT